MMDFKPLSFEDIAADDRPSLTEALVPIIAMILFLSIGIVLLDLGTQIPLIWAIIFTGLFVRYKMGYSWDELYEGISKNVMMGLQVIFIIFTIYGLISSLILAGTIPALMYYGLELLTPAVFLPLAAILSATVALAIGSSWTAAGTIGVALMAIGSALGFSEPVIAGAVLSGAYTGDKQSPLSDSTNLAAAISNTDLYEHVNAMRTGTLIAFGLSVVLYTVLGLEVSGSVPVGQVSTIQNTITSSYSITPLVFLPLLFTFGLALYGTPPLPSLGGGIFASVLTAVALQDTGFSDAWLTLLSGTDPKTELEVVNSLLRSDGMSGASGLVIIILAALTIGGMFERTGILAVLTYHLRRLIHDVASLTFVTAATSVMLNVVAATPYMAIVVPGMSYRNLYQEQGLESKNLSRAIDAAGSTTGALIPWNSTAVFVSGVLGVPTLSYAPYYFFGFLSPIILLLMGMTGWQIIYKSQSDIEETTAVS